MDDDGIPFVDARVFRGRKAGRRLVRDGVDYEDIFIDPMSAYGYRPIQRTGTLETIVGIKESCRALKPFGLSNISFGLPGAFFRQQGLWSWPSRRDWMPLSWIPRTMASFHWPMPQS